MKRKSDNILLSSVAVACVLSCFNHVYAESTLADAIAGATSYTMTGDETYADLAASATEGSIGTLSGNFSLDGGGYTLYGPNTSSTKASGIYIGGGYSLAVDNTTFKQFSSAIKSNNANSNIEISNSIFDINTASSSGGAIYNSKGTLSVLSTYFTNNTAGRSGGAIYNYSKGTFSVLSTYFEDNEAGTYGGAIYNGTDTKTTSTSNTYSGNSAVQYGGAIFNGTRATVISTGDKFKNNSVTGSAAQYGDNLQGGAINNVGSGSVIISNGIFDLNSCEEGYGGAVYNAGKLTISDTELTNNTALYGGAIFDQLGTTVITNSTFSSNNAGQGGAINIGVDTDNTGSGSVSIYNSEFTGNTAETAGAIGNFNVLNLYDSTFTSNSATASGVDNGGGAMFLGAKSVTLISNTEFSSNTAKGNGGAIAMRTGEGGGVNNDAILDILNSTFTGNTASGNGGAIYNTFFNSDTNEGYVTVSGSTFTSNSAANGGAVYNSELPDKDGNYASIYITDTTFTSNSASSSGGAFYNGENAEAVIENSSFYSNSASSSGGAIYTAADLTINSTDGYQTVFSGNSASIGNAIYAASEDLTIKFNLTNAASVLLEDDIDGETGYNVDISGDSTSTTFYLYNDISNADVSIGNTTLNTLNDEVYTYNFNSFTLTESINMAVDVDLSSVSMDRIATNGNNYGENAGTLTVSSMNALSDTTKDSIAIYFAETGLKDYVKSGVSSLKAPIYNYTVSYDNRDDGGYFVFKKAGVNPSVLASSVAAQLGGYLTQLNSYEEAFRNMDMYMLMTKKQRQALKNANKYAAAADTSLAFSPLSTPYTDKAGWVRPYTTFESVGLKNGPDVSNVAYGMYGGLESEMYDLGNGWDGIYSIYAGYNGSHQAYQGNSIYQNGGTLGIVGMAYKDNFFTGLTVNAGANAGQASTMYGNDDFSMLMAGIASKTGYNYEFADGKFVIQPHFLMSYSFVNTFDYTSAAGLRIDSDPLHAIQLEPGFKFIGNLNNGWQPYAGVSVVWNLMDKTHFTANDVSLPELSVKPFVKYGIGIRKTWGKRFVGYLQTFLTNGGRNGIGIKAGFRWTLGKDPSKYTNSTGEKKYIQAKV